MKRKAVEIKNKTFLARQGDLLIKSIDALPKRLKLRKTNVILYGEVTGHAHRLEDGKVYDGLDGFIYLEVLKNTQIVHEEHGAINLKKGFYSIKRQREYVMADMVKVVRD